MAHARLVLLDDTTINALYRVDGTPRLLIASTEFSLQYHQTWWEVAPARRAEVLARIREPGFQQELDGKDRSRWVHHLRAPLRRAADGGLEIELPADGA